ncbi:MAG: hypothetical protein HRT92_05415 [Piscirickettsiaceae bacterium]|nr:hypothetical protein [Piscirickettsiaceae bacterium]
MPVMVMAGSSIEFSIGQWSFDKIQAKNLNTSFRLTEKGLGFIATVDSIQLAEPIGKLSKITLSCDELIIVSEQYSCAKGTIGFQQKELSKQILEFEVEAHPEKNKYKIEIENLKLASATFSITAIFKNDQWKVFADTPQLQLSSLIQFLSPYLQNEQREILANWSIDAVLKLDLDVFGSGEQITAIGLDLTGDAINISDSGGLYVSEDLANSLNLEAKKVKQDWQWQVELDINNGQGYADPVFIDFTETALLFKAKGQWLNQQAHLNVNTMSLNHDNVMQLHGDFSADKNGLIAANIKVDKSKLSQLYSIWLQPFVLGTAMDNLELAGDISAQFQQQGDQYQLKIGLDEVFSHEQSGLFSIDGLSGEVAWTNAEQAVNTALHWQSASVYALTLGESSIQAEVASSSLSLLEPWILPILDGELILNNFTFNHQPNAASTWNFEGELMPISMESLSSTLGWPLLHGQLSGVIPKVHYAEHKIKVDGALKVNLFEGSTIIRDLELETPFGALPQLKANISLKGLNLETLTRTFDFGKITGRLDGKINNLRLANWQPVQFDAVFATPEGDKSRRRISQKAVDNLSQVGGGPTGILQRSVLRFFEDFSYQALGLSCRLRNEVCEMAGVAEADHGYYIVKGGGLPPRINVVGYTRRVDWPDLIERLKSVSQNSEPIVIE